MADERIFSKQLIFDGKHHRGQRAITTAGNELCLALFFKKAVKSVFGKQARNTGKALGGVHIVINHDGVVLGVIVTQGIGIEQKAQGWQNPPWFDFIQFETTKVLKTAEVQKNTNAPQTPK